MKTFVVVNPAAGGGRAGKQWLNISRALRDAVGNFDFAVTEKSGDATVLVRDAVANSARTIIAVGGDGTINEAINGLCDGESGPAADINFGFVMVGTGGDFRRSFDLPKGVAAAIERLKSGRTSMICLLYTSDAADE